ncbi:MAG: glycine zipper 2TM domain-containing protein [Gammaproteobacteria bacterium]|uniref:glycine zipper 2TM domain-containing protein n=1 Tax=Pseudomaricurvus alcaniphilus TaxID=1166482 RepID=UPI00140C741B|nr:glycine zipper 2TM domain-containing protein [Pseudomaricurvus alcaniphilus]MBR9911744.1 glycine zipper 2TM domain-containing protein [Gammaproteobacteria bacterium]NHN39164.1 glycine zipper 2TM domain-containing protein [Pseudomaricurvus alcaniphilus]
MNTTLIAVVLATGFASLATALPAVAEHKHKKHSGHYRGNADYNQVAYAPVTSVKPIYKTITHRIPERSCWTETRYVPSHRGYQSHTPTLLGTIIGGAIGNEVGHNKTNKKVGTVVGAAVGASLARDWRHHNSASSGYSRPVSEEVCEINERLEYEERIVGYNVTYRYQGQRYQTRMDHHPGKKIKVAVNVTPLY